MPPPPPRSARALPCARHASPHPARPPSLFRLSRGQAIAGRWLTGWDDSAEKSDPRIALFLLQLYRSGACFGRKIMPNTHRCHIVDSASKLPGSDCPMGPDSAYESRKPAPKPVWAPPGPPSHKIAPSRRGRFREKRRRSLRQATRRGGSTSAAYAV
eukprot:SAG22_NODE_234_length_14360_cov_13.245915_2_plen_157_part_00